MENNWSVKMADSMLKGKPEFIDKWAYDNGVVMKGFEKIWESTGDKKYFDFVKEHMDKFIQDDGTVKTYDPKEYNIDHINNGKLLFSLYKQTGEEKYKKAAYQLREQLNTHPRTSEGAFWHKDIYKNQIWLDGLYMGAPFYAEFIKEFETDKNYDDITKQFEICYKHLKDEKTGLLYHAWDENKTEFWCDKSTGLSKNFWGRAMGWFVMAIVDVLSIIPENQKDRKNLIDMLNDCLNALVKVQDEDSGVWYQVLDQKNRKCNYLEASCSCMILCAMSKAYNDEYIKGSKWLDIIDRAYNGIIDEFVLITDDGYVNLNKICQVAGLGNKQKRDGTFAYYMSEPIVCNDMKGVGAFLQAMFEYENMKR